MNLIEELGANLSGLELLQAMIAGDLRAGLGDTLGIKLVEAGEGRVALEALPDVAHYNAGGTVHGGFTASLLDFACGYATLTRMAPRQRFTTLELKVSYLKAITRETGMVRAEGTVVSLGRRVAFTEGRLTDGTGRLLASATSTLIVLSP